MANDLTMDPTVTSTTHLSEIERVVDTFIAPSKTFADIRRSATWWLPFLLLVIFSVAVGATVQKDVGFERAYTNQLHNSPTQEDRINQLPPDQKARTIATSAKVTQGITFAFPVLLAIGFAIYSLILWAGFNFGLGAQTTFAQVFAVTWYASLPYLIRSILTIITLHFGGNPEAYDYNNPVGTNPAFFMPEAGAGMKALLGSFDLIKLWSLALQVIGMAIVAKKTIAQSAVIVVGWFVLSVALATGIAFAFS